MAPRYCFDLHRPDDVWCGASFHVLIRHVCIFFSEVSIKVFGPFLTQVLSYC